MVVAGCRSCYDFFLSFIFIRRSLAVIKLLKFSVSIYNKYFSFSDMECVNCNLTLSVMYELNK